MRCLGCILGFMDPMSPKNTQAVSTGFLAALLHLFILSRSKLEYRGAAKGVAVLNCYTRFMTGPR